MPAPPRSSSGSSQSSTGSITWRGGPATSRPSASPSSATSPAQPSSSSSSSLSTLFSALTFYLLPGCQSIPLTRTLADLGAAVQPSPPLPSSSLTPTSSQARRALTQAWTQLLSISPLPWRVVVEGREIRKLRALMLGWIKAGEGDWGNAAWVQKLRGVNVYDAGWVFDSKRKERLQPIEGYRVELLEADADEAKRPATAEAVGQKRKRPEVEEREELSAEGTDEEDAVVEAKRPPPSTRPPAVAAKRLKVDQAPPSKAASREPQKSAAAVKLKAATSRVSLVALLSSDDGEDGQEEAEPTARRRDDGKEEEKRPAPQPRLQRLRKPSTGAVEALGNRLQAQSQRHGEWEISPRRRGRPSKLPPPAQEDEKADRDDGDDDAANERERTPQPAQDVEMKEEKEREVRENSQEVEEERKEAKAVERKAAEPQRPKVSLGRKPSPAAPPAAAGRLSHPAATTDKDGLSPLQSPSAVTQHSGGGGSGSTSGASKAVVGPTRPAAPAAKVDRIDLITPSQPCSEGGGGDVIFETPPSQASVTSLSVASQAVSSSSLPLPLPVADPSSASLASPPFAVDFPLPLLLHALYLHSGAVPAALRYLRRQPAVNAAATPPADGSERNGELGPWSAEEDAAVKRRPAGSKATAAEAEVLRKRGVRAVEVRRAFLLPIASQ